MDTNTSVKKRKGCLIPALLFLILVVVMIFVVSYFSSGTLAGSPRERISKDMGITLEQADGVLSVFEQCAIANYKSGVHDELLDNWDYDGQRGFRVAAGGERNIIVYLDAEGKVDIISWSEIPLYQDGAAVGKLTDYTLTQKEIDRLMYNCEEAVKKVLATPSTAKFPLITDWQFYKTPDEVVISSYVDAQNGFGAQIRNTFVIKLQPDQTTVTSFVLDGQELMEK